MSIESIRKAAEHFLKHETPFHLGEMVTEQSHPATRRLSQTLGDDTKKGIALLLRVDDDLPPVVDRILDSESFRRLRSNLFETLQTGNRIVFSGCGATGRLSILLDAAHRKFCQASAKLAPDSESFFGKLAEQTFAVMTGGDFALIRSVESFEDFISFGKRQIQDAGFKKEDCLVAISEGGETSSVIGTIHAALELGAKAHFLFNNPAELLTQKVERSRRVIVDPGVNVIDLTSGPMAVAGSTRMQATTMELLIAGLAFEAALADHLEHSLSPETLRNIGFQAISLGEGAKRFRNMLGQIRSDRNLTALAGWAEFECSIYSRSGLVTYFADKYVIDIFTDTTERAPTFMTPPFRSIREPENPVSWAFVKDPTRTTEGAWRNILGRTPSCIRWTVDDYRNLGASDRMIAGPPKIDRERLNTYLIGNEADDSRTEKKPNVAIAFLVGEETEYLEKNDDWVMSFRRATVDFEQKKAILLGPKQPNLPSDWEGGIFYIELDLPRTPLDLFSHLAAKIVLNNVSTATMGKLGRLNGNWMAHVEATNKKLIDRSIRLVTELTDLDYESACFALFETLDELSTWPEARRKTVSPAAYTVGRLTRRNPE